MATCEDTSNEAQNKDCDSSKFRCISNLLKEMNECCHCSCNSRKIDLIKKCIYLVSKSEITKEDLNTNMAAILKNLESFIDIPIVPPFKNRDYSSFEKDDFKWYPELSECILTFFIEILDLGIFLHIHTIISDCDGTNIGGSMHWNTILLKIITLIAGYGNKCLWSTVENYSKGYQLLQRLLTTLNCEFPHDLLLRKGFFETSSASGEIKSGKVTFLVAFLLECKNRLSNGQWLMDPFYSEAFCWVISQNFFNHFSDHIDQVMGTSLNFLDDHQIANKIKGISCLLNLIKNATSEELRWFNRTEVIYEALKRQINTKESDVFSKLFPCLFRILQIMEKSPNLDRHHAIFEILIRDTIGENLLIIRRLYIEYLNALLLQIGASSMRHLQKLIQIWEQYIEIEDGVEETARIGAMRLLQSVICITWPRIGHYNQRILRGICKLLIEINSSSYHDGQKTLAQSTLNDTAVGVLKILTRVSPDVIHTLKTLQMSRALHQVSSILHQVEIYDITDDKLMHDMIDDKLIHYMTNDKLIHDMTDDKLIHDMTDDKLIHDMTDDKLI